MRILVTGNLGFIGTELVGMAKAQGHFVRGVDVGFFKDCLLYPPVAEADEQLRMDIRDVTESAFDAIDVVIHLAALSNDPLSELDKNLTFDINHRGAINCARTAMAAGVKRFIFASSASVYGVANSTVDECSNVNPLTPYAESKYLSEQDLFALATDQFITIALRPSTAYGLGARLRTDIVLNNFCAWAHSESRINIMSDGTPLRPIVNVRDIAKTFLTMAAMPAQLVQRQVFNVGRNEDNFSVRQMAEAVQRHLPGCQLNFTGEHSDSRSYSICFNKLTSLLSNISPLTTSINSGIAELIQGYKLHQLTKSDFLAGKFTRLQTIKSHLNSKRLGHDLRWLPSAGDGNVST